MGATVQIIVLYTTRVMALVDHPRADLRIVWAVRVVKGLQELRTTM